MPVVDACRTSTKVQKSRAGGKNASLSVSTAKFTTLKRSKALTTSVHKSRIVSLLCFLLLATSLYAQQRKNIFIQQDTLRGSITPERSWWDVVMYDLQVEPDFLKFSLKGSNTIYFKTLQAPGNHMQIDLQEPLQITGAWINETPVSWKRNGNVFFIEVPLAFQKTNANTTLHALRIDYVGIPKAAINPPWDGGLIWKKDGQGNPWIGVACQGLGASVWYPCKDHQSDEPDSVQLKVIVPDTLVNVSNGRFRKREILANGKAAFTWFVSNPINSYNITFNIGKYVHFADTLMGEKGKLDLDYWVLEENLEKAKKHFEQVKPMLRAFEYWFGPYPFYEDGFKLVESWHLGMEHQSAVAYGNRYMNGYRGSDLSGTGWGKKFDFIIIHESGHEWFGNNITTRDIADMWVHEGFTNYSETLFTDYMFGKQAGNEYVQGIRRNIRNDQPIIGPYNVNTEGSGDMYYKGANLIHTIRQIIDNDETFRSLLRAMNQQFYHQTTTSKAVEDFISSSIGIDLISVFDQYLRTTQIPMLEYYMKKQGKHCNIYYRWSNCAKAFNMPIHLPFSASEMQRVTANTGWKKMKTAFGQETDITPLLNRNYYVQYKKINP